MTKVQRRRLILVVLLVAGLAAAATFVLLSIQNDLTYFREPSAVAAGNVPAHTTFRLGGIVEKGTVKHSDDSLLVEFNIADCDASIPVHYAGVLPDLFREGQGIITTGKLNNQGVFIADEVLAKHDENYTPPQVKKATTDESGNSCMPADL